MFFFSLLLFLICEINCISLHRRLTSLVYSPLLSSLQISTHLIPSLLPPYLSSPCRLDGYRSELGCLQDVQNNQEKEKNSNRTFPCGYCRTVLSSATCVVTENRHLNTLFNYHLEVAIRRETEAREKENNSKSQKRSCECAGRIVNTAGLDRVLEFLKSAVWCTLAQSLSIFLIYCFFFPILSYPFLSFPFISFPLTDPITLILLHYSRKGYLVPLLLILTPYPAESSSSSSSLEAQ